MSKKKNGPNRNAQQRQKPTRGNSSLKDHQQKGRTLTPPLLDIVGGKLKTVSWELDSLPDYLLICAHMRDQSMRAFANLNGLINLVDEAASVTTVVPPQGTAYEPAPAEAADNGADETTEAAPRPTTFVGRLTQFEAFTPEQRAAALAALDTHDVYEDLITEDFAHVLGMYPDAPGSWLLEPWRKVGLSIDPERAQRVLGDLLAAAGPRRSPTATWTKAFMCNRMAESGQASVWPGAGSSMRLLADWPNHETDFESSAAAATIGAMFSALQMFGAGDEGKQWAEKFWRANWRLFACVQPEPRLQRTTTTSADDEATDDASTGTNDSNDNTDSGSNDDDGGRSYWQQTMKAANDAVAELQTEFGRLASTTDPDLYNPDRYEVLTGLVGRTLRYLDVFAAYPAMWTMEHGAPLLRTFVETRIVFNFLTKRNDPALFAKFKAYGMGKLKLLKLQVEELIDELDDPPAQMVTYAGYLDTLVNQDITEEFQPIEVGGSFAGIDTRKMAIEAGLQAEYRILFQPASSNVHGEWSIIDENVFTRCANPAHRRHRILRNSLDSAAGPAFLESLLGHASTLIADYKTATASERRTII